jgi:hypothetical protein
MMLCHEGQHATLALDSFSVRVRDNLKRVNGSSREAVDRIEYLKRANQIELIDRGNNKDNDAPSGGMAEQSRLL